ncbi:MAG: response regulator [Bacteriodetes bacterium]|nr:response regulator [Bacteroidota bacterium]
MDTSLEEYEELLTTATTQTEKLKILGEINFLRQFIIDSKTTRYIRLMMRLAKAEGDIFFQVQALRYYTYNLYHKGEFKKAKANTLKLAALLKESNNRDYDASVYRDLGLISESLGDFGNTLHYYYLSLRSAEETGNNVHLFPICINLGLFFFNHLRDDVKAIQYFLRARKLTRIEQRWSAHATSCNYLAVCNLSLGNIKKGKKYLDEGIRVATRHNLSTVLIYLKDTLSQYYKDIGDHEASAQILEEVHTEFERTSNYKILKSGYLSLAYNYIHQKKWDKVEDAIRRYDRLRKKFGIERDMDSFFSLKAELAKHKKNYPMAIKYLEQKIELQTKNYRKDWQQKMDLLEQSYKLESYKKDKEVAESVAKMRMDFLSNMSHEIRSPMNAVLGLTTILLRNNDANENTNHLRTIKASAEHLLTVINDILDLNKIDAGKLSIEYATVAIQDVLSAVVQGAELKAAEKNLYVRFNISNNVPAFIIGDASRISQILINLVNNGLKFTEKGGVEISVNCESKPRSKNIQLLFKVRDTGIGMSKEQCDKLFRPYEQAETGTYRKYGGTGLGLHISKQLTELMGGVVSLESKKGKGSIFTVSIPVQKDTISTNTQKTYANSQQDYTVLRNKTYLIVEDNEVDIDILRESLKTYLGENVKLIIARNGKEALRLLKVYGKQSQGKNIDFVLSDLIMPEMNGFDLAKEVKKNYTDSKVIAVTSILVPLNNEQLLKEGFDGLVNKPYKMEKLIDTIYSVYLK